jgi:hypothetical protein
MSWDEQDYGRAQGEERPRDAKIDAAKKLVLEFLSNHTGVFYIKQLQVLLEGNFYHWIVGRAVGELIDEDAVGSQKVPLKNGKAVFLFKRSLRYRQRRIKKAVQVIQKYSLQEVSRGSGEWAENLFLVALMAHGFAFASRDISEQRNTKRYAGQEWPETMHQLDFIVARDGIAYGAEVKNTWDYIPPNELRVKQRMCEFLGLKPLFIWRYAPKSYMWKIIQGGGYGMIFKTHIFPPTHKALAEEISMVLRLECDCPRRIPDGILERFVKWHQKKALRT